MPKKKSELIRNIELATKRDGHIHKFQLVNLGSEIKPFKVYKCMKIGCTTYHPNRKLVINLPSICHKCGEDFVITADIVRANTVKPKCINCRAGGKKKINPREENALDKLIAGMRMR